MNCGKLMCRAVMAMGIAVCVPTSIWAAPQYIPQPAGTGTLTPAQAKEYMESTSPLKSGGMVTHRYSPQTGWQRSISPGSSGSPGLPVSSGGGATQANSSGNLPSVLQGNGSVPAPVGLQGAGGQAAVVGSGNPNSVGAVANSAAAANPAATNPVLPWETSARFAQVDANALANTGYYPSNVPLDPWQNAPRAPTLGLLPANPNQSAWRSGGVIARPQPVPNYLPYQTYSLPGTNPPLVGNQLPTNPVWAGTAGAINPNQGAANTVPQLGPVAGNVNGPLFVGPTGTYSPGTYSPGTYPQVTYPQAGFPNGAYPSANVPGFPARSPYQPLVRLQNLPPGTYVGQGVIGQPKAYVDGQPMRNLFRYILP